MQQPTTPHEASDWATTRGEKWAANLAGMEAMLRPVDEPLLAALRLDAPVRIADLGCGGGATTLALQRRAPAGSVVHGFDISPVLVERARQRLGPDEPAVAFEIADLQTASPASPYHRLVSRFGVMFFDDPAAAFANLARWLAPGGRFAFAVWGPPQENRWLSSVRDVIAQFVEIPQPPPEGPGPYRYADAAALLALLDAAGLSALEVHPWRGELPIGGGLPPAPTAEFALAAFSSFEALLAEAGPSARAAALRALTAHFAAHERDGAAWMQAYVHLVTGVRP